MKTKLFILGLVLIGIVLIAGCNEAIIKETSKETSYPVNTEKHSPSICGVGIGKLEVNHRDYITNLYKILEINEGEFTETAFINDLCNKLIKNSTELRFFIVGDSFKFTLINNSVSIGDLVCSYRIISDIDGTTVQSEFTLSKPMGDLIVEKPVFDKGLVTIRKSPIEEDRTEISNNNPYYTANILYVYNQTKCY